MSWFCPASELLKDCLDLFWWTFDLMHLYLIFVEFGFVLCVWLFVFTLEFFVSCFILKYLSLCLSCFTLCLCPLSHPCDRLVFMCFTCVQLSPASLVYLVSVLVCWVSVCSFVSFFLASPWFGSFFAVWVLDLAFWRNGRCLPTCLKETVSLFIQLNIFLLLFAVCLHWWKPCLKRDLHKMSKSRK